MPAYLVINFPGIACYDTAKDVESANIRVFMGYYGKVNQISVFETRPDICDELPFYDDLRELLKRSTLHVPGFHVCR